MLSFDFDVAGTETVRQTGQIFLEKLPEDSHISLPHHQPAPFTVASDITRLALQYHPDHAVNFLDPCIGTGHFFSALLHDIAADSNRYQLRSAHGVEHDERFATMAHDLWAPAGLHVHDANFMALTTQDLPQATLVLSHPLATQHHELTSEQKIQAANTAEHSTGIRPTGVADFYNHYVLGTHKFLAPNAVAAWVLPTKFLHHSSGRALRTYLAKQVQVHRIHSFDPITASEQAREQVAASGLSVVIFTNTTAKPDHTFECSSGGELFEPTTTAHIKCTELQPDDNWLGLLHEDHPTLTQQRTLSDYFHIRWGWQVPAAKFFIQPEARAWALGIQPQHMYPMLPPPHKVTGKVVEADDEGYPLGEQRYVVLTSNDDIYTLEEKDPAFLQYLDSANGNTRAATGRPNSPMWYSLHVRRPAPLLVQPATENDPGVFRFIINNSDGIAGPGWVTMAPNLGFAKPWFLNNPVNWPEVVEVLESIRLPEGTQPPALSPEALAGLDATPLTEYLATFD